MRNIVLEEGYIIENICSDQIYVYKKYETYNDYIYENMSCNIGSLCDILYHLKYDADTF